ncbi:cyclic AMP-dependent transcription factor ATF-4-like [Oryzias latipes]|uniref:Cyclic AMP-dependent transcription factor ATF-4 n=2 Tax=Oryzias latipes TaxID=8090 RepID=A0A3P9KJ23_ORYLA|nr:activating transcription factor 4b [Oryzias latipes]BAL14285.1 activating transcription factor 4 (2) [Oryzias latipes]
MTMMMTSSQCGLEDMEALLCGSSSPMAEGMDSIFAPTDKIGHQEGEGGASLEGDALPVSPLASSSPSSPYSPPRFYSPPPSPSSLLQRDKGGNESDLLSLPWLDPLDQLRSGQKFSDDRKEDVLGDLHWMAERVDLSEFDLDSLIGSCSPAEESPSSPEDLLASLDVPMELDSFHLSALSAPDPLPPPPELPPNLPADGAADESESHIDSQEILSSPFCVPDPQEELEIKSEPASPIPSPPAVASPSAPDFTLDLGSEVDVPESEVKPIVASVVPQVPKIVLSLSPARIILVLAPKSEVSVTTTPEVIQCSPPTSPTERSHRSRPYPKPSPPASPSMVVDEGRSSRAAGGTERTTLKSPKDKKLKKMEQNKTAATRYRQKKRVEQDSLLAEHAVLERKNVELTEKAESLTREIEYLKELMEEVRQTKLKRELRADI